MIVWGLVSGATAAANGYGSLVTIRFLLGVVEAPFFPGAIFLDLILVHQEGNGHALCLALCWKLPKQLCVPTRATNLAVQTSLTLVQAFGSLIALGVTETLAGAHGLSSWRWLYIIEASMTGSP